MSEAVLCTGGAVEFWMAVPTATKSVGTLVQEQGEMVHEDVSECINYPGITMTHV